MFPAVDDVDLGLTPMVRRRKPELPSWQQPGATGNPCVKRDRRPGRRARNGPGGCDGFWHKSLGRGWRVFQQSGYGLCLPAEVGAGQFGPRKRWQQ